MIGPAGPGGNPTEGPDARMRRLRAGISRLDASLVALLAERVALAREIGGVKDAAGLMPLDPAREAEVVRAGAALARQAGLDAEEVREILWRVMGLCRRAQEGE